MRRALKFEWPAKAPTPPPPPPVGAATRRAAEHNPSISLSPPLLASRSNMADASTADLTKLTFCILWSLIKAKLHILPIIFLKHYGAIKGDTYTLKKILRLIIFSHQSCSFYFAFEVRAYTPPGLKYPCNIHAELSIHKKNTRMDIRVSMPCSCTMDVHSSIFKSMDFSAWMLPRILHRHWQLSLLFQRKQYLFHIL